MELVLTDFDLYASHLPILPLAMLIALAPFPAISPAMSKDLNVPLICDHKLPNRNVPHKPRIMLIYPTPTYHGWPYPIRVSQGVHSVALVISLELSRPVETRF